MYKKLFFLLPAIAWILISFSYSDTYKFQENIVLTENEKNLIDSIGTLKIMVDDSFSPLSYYDLKSQKYSGASVDLFEKIADDIGLKYTYVREADMTWSKKLQKISDKTIDLLIPISITDQRIKSGYFSNPYYSTYYTLISYSSDKNPINSINDISGKRIGIVKNTSISKTIETIGELNEIIYFESDKDMYSGIKNNKVDLIVQNENVFREDLFFNELFNLKISYRILESPKDYCLYFSKTDNMKNLIPIVNKALKKYNFEKIIKEYELDDIELMNKYIQQRRIKDSIIWLLSLLFMLTAVLIYNLKKTLSFNKRLEEEIIKTEMAYLQSQIKPHFLYNALSAITSFCYSNGEKAGELLNSLSKYLRFVFSINNRGEKIFLEKEIELIESYINIEKARYGDRLNVHFDIDKELMTYKIIPLSIQPIVENSISHGIMKKPEGGHIYLLIYEKNENLNVIVKDDGIGMTKEKIEEIFNDNSFKYGVGLKNIISRLSNFGENRVNIKSVLGEGTEVSLILPFEKGGQNV